MVFDLRKQDVGKTLPLHVVLSRPRQLQYSVITVREERFAIAIQYGF
jgi:hypothetical protein